MNNIPWIIAAAVCLLAIAYITSVIIRARRICRRGYGPPPPRHLNCRCTAVPAWETVGDDRAREHDDPIPGAWVRPLPDQLVKVDFVRAIYGNGFGLSPVDYIHVHHTIFVDDVGVVWDGQEHPDAQELPAEMIGRYKSKFESRMLIDGTPEFREFFETYGFSGMRPPRATT